MERHTATLVQGPRPTLVRWDETPALVALLAGWRLSFRSPGTLEVYSRSLGIALTADAWSSDRAEVAGVPVSAVPGTWLRWLAEHDLDPLTVRRPIVDAWVAYLQGAGYAPSTIVGRLASVRSLYRYARTAGVVDRDPTEDVARPRVSGGVPRRWANRDQLVALLAAVTCDRDELVVRLCALGGLRASEVTGLDVDDVHLDGPQPWLRVHGKGAKTRTVGLDAATAALLARWLNGRTTGPLIPGDAGQDRYSRQAVSRAVARVARAAGISRLSAHDLRRSCVTLLLDAAAPVDRVAAHVGHSSVRTTTGVYDQARGTLDRTPVHLLAAYVDAAR